MRKIIFTCLLVFFGMSLSAQVGLRVEGSSFSVLNQPLSFAVFRDFGLSFQKEKLNFHSPLYMKTHFVGDSFSLYPSGTLLSTNNYNNDLAFFCKLEFF